ncbi:hypothetical protein [Yoonia sp.]
MMKSESKIVDISNIYALLLQAMPEIATRLQQDDRETENRPETQRAHDS